MADLREYMPGRVLAFTAGDGDEVPHPRVSIVEVTDLADGEIELAFDMQRPKRRVYLKVRQSDLLAAMQPQEPQA